MQADCGEDDVVNVVEVATVSGGHDVPVLDVGDGLFDDKAYGGDLFVEPALVVGRLYSGFHVDGGEPIDVLVSGVADKTP